MTLQLRQSLLASAALSAMVLGSTAASRTALAANECGAIPAGPNSTVNCTALIIGGGIEYVPAAPNEVFTLNIGDGTVGGAVSSSAPPAGIGGLGQSAATIATIAVNPAALATGPIPLSGVPATSIMNINQFSQLSGSSIGAIVWTTGAGNNSTINNSGSVLSLGTGNLSLGHGLLAVSNGGDAAVTNNATGTVNAFNSGMFAYSLSGTSTVTALNNGTITAQRGDGISTIDPLLGVLPTAGAATATNNLTINAGRTGVNVTSAGNATVNLGAASVINAGTFTNGAGAYAVSVTGNAIINANALSQTTSTSGPGLVGISLAGTATVDAGEVTSGAGAVSLGGFVLPPLPIPGGPLPISGGIMALSLGNATARAHGDITTDGSFGVLAFSASGDATAQSDAGIVIDPPIGMSAITFGAGTASVPNNGTVQSTLIGLLGVNVGNGEVNIVNSQTGVVDATTGTGVVAIKTGPGSAAPLPGGYSVIVSNDNLDGGLGGQITANSGAGVLVTALGGGPGALNNVLVSNTNNATITGNGGGLLTSVVGVLADGNVQITNDVNSLMSTAVAVGDSGIALSAASLGGNVNVLNDNGSAIVGRALLGTIAGSTTFTNDRGSEWTSSGINAMASLVDTTINNERGAEIEMNANGGITANIMLAGQDVRINNNRGAEFSMNGIGGLAINVMAAGRDVEINNDRGADFTIDGIAGIGLNVMVADRDVTINNNRGGDFNLLGIIGVGVNVMVAGRDATINNDRGGAINMVGLIGATANVMIADRDAIINNNRGGDINLVGLNGNFMFGGDNAEIHNETGATLNLLGFNGSFMAAVNDVTVNNATGAEINLLGINTLGFASVNGATTLNNTSTVNVGTLLGIAGFASFNGLDNFNNEDGLLNMRNGNSDYLAVLDDPIYGNGVGDVTTMSGNFNGGGTSSFGIDAFLGGPGPASSSDQLFVGGDVTSVTALLVNDTNPGAGSYNPTGIRFAHVDGEAPEGSFFLPGGPIDKGFFDYDILRVETASSDWLLVSAPNDRAAELPALLTGAQTLWYESSGVWLDRTADLRRQLTTCQPVDEAAMAVNGTSPQITPTADVAPECHYKRYGLWFRGYGGQYDRNDGVEYDQDIWGGEAGIDFVLSDADSGYGAFIVGLLGGYVTSSMDFDSTSDSADLEGATFGAYATYLSGGWYADLLFKANLLDVDYETSFDDENSDDNTDATSLGVRLDTGYRFGMDSFFLEPQATLAYVNTSMDDFSLLATDVDPEDGESLRGRLGLRAGMSWDSGNMIFEPFLVGSVWHEFEGDNEVNLTSGGSVTVSDQAEQTYGEVGGGINVLDADGGMSLFAKVDALVGGDIESISGKVGGRFNW